MKFAVNVPVCVGSSEYGMSAFRKKLLWDHQHDYAVRIEPLGVDRLAGPDHIMASAGPTAEGFSTLTGLAAVTEVVYLYPKMFNDQLRHGPLLSSTRADRPRFGGSAADETWRGVEAR